MGLGEKKRLWERAESSAGLTLSRLLCPIPAEVPSSWQQLQGLHSPAQQMNPSGRCTVQLSLLPRGEVILEGILFIQEIFLEIFTCQDYMFKFFDEASSGPLAEFLKSFACISVGFSADKRPYCITSVVEATIPFSKLRR